jgi:hypothetical protein
MMEVSTADISITPVVKIILSKDCLLRHYPKATLLKAVTANALSTVFK